MGLRDPRLVNPEARAKREQSVQDKQKRQANKHVGHRPKLRADPNQCQRAKREKAKKGDRTTSSVHDGRRMRYLGLGERMYIGDPFDCTFFSQGLQVCIQAHYFATASQRPG